MPTPTYDLITSVTVSTTTTTKVTFSGFSTSYRHIIISGAASGDNSGATKIYNEASLWWTSQTYQTRQRYNNFAGDFWFQAETSPTFGWYPANQGGGGYMPGFGATDTFGVKYVLLPRYNDTVEHAVYNDGNTAFYPDVTDTDMYGGAVHGVTTSTSAITSFEIGSQATYLKQGSQYFVYGLTSA